MIKVLIYQDGKPINEFSQADNRREITIGRAPGCLIRLDDSGISRLHAIIHQNAGNWVIERRANFGTVLLNGQEIENAILQGGEEVQINDFSLRIQIEEGARSSTQVGGTKSGQIPSEDGRTKVIGGGAQALFRFEPGSANLSEFIMPGERAVFGRASNCDVVLMDKKASRKHLEIIRQGLSFYLKDLSSANGTLLNERKVTEEVELVPGDVIQVGESKFQFSIENKEFFSQAANFLPVPSEFSAPVESMEMGALMDPAMGAAASETQPRDAGIADDAQSVAATPEKSILKRAWKKYLSYPPTYRYAIIFFVLIIGLGFFQEEEKPEKKVVKPPIKRDEQGRIIRTFDQLSEEKKEFVRKTYKELVDAQQKRDYQKMLDLIAKINAVVDEYRDLKPYEAIAKRGKEEEEIKERDRVQREKQEALRKEVAALEDKGKEVFTRALAKASARPELTAVIQDIYTKDPNNRLAQDWTAAIKEREVQEEREKEVARQKEQLKERVEKEFSSVMAIFKQDKYKEALAASDKLFELGYSEEKFTERVAELQKEIREKLASILDPLLKEAETQRGQGGDLIKANETYMKILTIDSQNKAAIKGLESIRDTLHTRARRLYSLAVLAESISDLSEAKDKFAKCLKTAPEDDIYRERCRSKLARYEAYQGQ